MNSITVAQPIIRTRQLTIEELKTIAFPIKIQSNLVIIDQGLTGHKLKTPVTLKLEKVLAVKEKGLIDYILTSFISERPSLIPFVFDNQSLIKMARHFLRHCSGSHGSCCNYTAHMQRYSAWLGYSPDLIIQDVKPVGNIPDPQRVQNHTGYLNDYLAELQDESNTETEPSNKQKERYIARSDAGCHGGFQLLWKKTRFGRIGYISKGPVLKMNPGIGLI